MQKQAPSVIYIVGDSRSGSTLLQTLLGLKPDVLVGGEIRRLVVEGPKSVPCSCGVSAQECEYWSEIIELKSLSDSIGVGDKRIARRLNQFVSLSFLGLRVLLPSWLNGGLSDKTTSGSMAVLRAMIDSGSQQLVVDSSKVPLHFAALRARMGSDVFPIFLYRDGRAIVYSKMQRTNISFADAVSQWRNSVLSMEIVRRLCPTDQQLVISYEDMCSDPQAVVNIIRNLAGMSSTTLRAEGMDKSSFHFIGGSPSFSESAGLVIQLDERWRTGLDRSQLELFDRKVGWLNKAIGYS